MRFTYLFPAVLAATVGAQSSQNLTQALSSNPNLSTLVQLLMGQTDLMKSLATASNITIVAPNNNAFTRFMNSSGAQATANPSMLTGTLSYHVLQGSFSADQIPTTPAFVPTLLKDPSFTNVTGGQVVEAVKMGNNVMFYGGLKMSSTVVKADTIFNGGVIHEIDTVLSVPVKDSTTAVDAGLTSLAGALTKADLVNTLDGLSDVTIFAPTNAAFAAISGSVENLSNEQLSGVLTYHVVNGTVAYSSGLSDGMSVKTLGGQDVKISIQNGNVFVNSARVIEADVLVGNGVVHVIDNVLNPQNPSSTPTSGDPPAFSASKSGSGTPFTSGITATTTALIATGTGSSKQTTTGQGSNSAATATAGAAPMHTGAMGAAALLGLSGAVLVGGLLG